jgi:hypothetical protein
MRLPSIYGCLALCDYRVELGGEIHEFQQFQCRGQRCLLVYHFSHHPFELLLPLIQFVLSIQRTTMIDGSKDALFTYIYFRLPDDVSVFDNRVSMNAIR